MITKFNLEADLDKLIECDALEILLSEDKTTVFIPYMMNDALECYFKFTGCKVMGEWDKEIDYDVTCSLVEENDRHGLILRQAKSNTVTIWYSAIEKHLELYQYHRIAHIWVKGQEKWRRLVYIVGTLYDKLNFMGPDCCNSTELSIVPIIGFAPYRYFSPIHESLDDYYRDTREALTALFDIAEKSNNQNLKNLLAKYTSDFTAGKLTPIRIWFYAMRLSKDKAFYNYLNSMIEAASLDYQPRSYASDRKKKLDALIDDATKAILAEGFTGEYPHFVKGKRTVTLYEEHPYVMQDFEYDGYDFKINRVQE